MLGAAHGPHQGVCAVDSEVEPSRHPFGQVASAVGSGHLGLIDELEGGELDRSVMSDLLFLADQDLLEGVDTETCDGEGRNRLVARMVDRTYVRSHDVNVPPASDEFNGSERGFLERVECGVAGDAPGSAPALDQATALIVERPQPAPGSFRRP